MFVKNSKICFLIAVVFMSMGITVFSDSLNILKNSGFEELTGKTPGWSLKPDKNCEISLDSEVKHSGNQSLKIINTNKNNYSKIRYAYAISVTPNENYTLQAWVRTDWDGPLKAEGPKSMLCKVLVSNIKGRSIGSSKKVISTFGKWRLIRAKFNTGNNKKIFVMAYLHRAAGTIWIDDIKLFKGKPPKESVVPEKSKLALRVNTFPKIHFSPGSIANEKIFYLLDNDVSPLTVNYYGKANKDEKLNLIIETPPGALVIADSANKLRPVGQKISQGFIRYNLPLLAGIVRNKLTDRSPHVLLLKATRDFKNGTMLRYYLTNGKSKTKIKSFKLTKISWPDTTHRMPKNFDIETFYAFTLGVYGKNENISPLFKELAKTYLKGGIKGSTVVKASSERRTWLRKKTWQWGGMAGFTPGFVNKFYHGKISYAFDKNGKAFSRNSECITWMLDNDIMKYINSSFLRYSTRLGGGDNDFDWWIFNYEPHSKGWQNCVCPRCMKAFSTWLGVADSQINPDMIETELKKKWQAFREQQNASIVEQVAKFIKKSIKNKSLKFGLCANPDSYWNPSVMDPYVDFHSPMIYYHHPATFFTTIQREVKRVSKPLRPAVHVTQAGFAQWTSPSALKLMLLSTAVAGGKGMFIWQGIHSLGSLGLVKMREALNAIAVFEPYFEENKRADQTVKVTPCAKNQITGYTVHKLGQRFLVSLFNFNSEKSAKISIKFPAFNNKKYMFNLPLENITLLPAAKNSKALWSARDLQRGFILDLPASETRFLELIPATEKPDAMKKYIKVSTPSGSFKAPSYIIKVPYTTPDCKKAVKMKNFWGKEVLAKEQTEAFCSYDGTNLYVTIRCHDTFINNIKANCNKRDGKVWKDDCIELFLQTGNPHIFYQIVVNSLGTIFDKIGYFSGKSGDVSWSSNAVTTTSIQKDKKIWEVKITIPWTALNLNKPKPGTQIKLNICRERKASASNANVEENSSWIPSYGSFTPPMFGKLILQKKNN
jgi:carbohydrate binding protein with CBM4/9 domain/cellulose/xylan binding protein with CBM9 domain